MGDYEKLMIENPKIARDLKVDILYRLENLDQDYATVGAAVGLSAEAVRKIAHKFGFSEEEHAIRKLEQERGEAEEWKPAPGLEGRYEVSSFGRIYAVRPGKIIQEPSEKKFGPKHSKTVPVLVASAFVGPNKGMKVRHRDGNTKNNFWRNLYYVNAFVPAVIRKVIAARAARGDKHAGIAFDLKLDPETVGMIAREEGVSSQELHRHLSAEESSELVRMVDAGVAYPKIAEALSISTKTIRVHYGKQAPRYKTSLGPEARMDIARRLEAGENRTLVAQEHGISREHARAIWKAAQKKGLI